MKISEIIIGYFKSIKKIDLIKKQMDQVEIRIAELNENMCNIKSISANEFGAGEISGIDYSSLAENKTNTVNENAGFVNKIINLENIIKNELSVCYTEREVLSQELFKIKLRLIVIESAFEELDELEVELIDLFYDKKIKKQTIAERKNYSKAYIGKKIKLALEKLKIP